MVKTQQHAARSTTVRELVKRAKGPQPELNARRDRAAAYFGCFPEKMDLQECLNIQRRAQEQFDCLPGEVKSRFGYQPQRLIEFVKKEENYNEALQMGLISIEAQKRRKEALKAKENTAAGQVTGPVEGK